MGIGVPRRADQRAGSKSRILGKPADRRSRVRLSPIGDPTRAETLGSAQPQDFVEGSNGRVKGGVGKPRGGGGDGPALEPPAEVRIVRHSRAANRPCRGPRGPQRARRSWLAEKNPPRVSRPTA